VKKCGSEWIGKKIEEDREYRCFSEISHGLRGDGYRIIESWIGNLNPKVDADRKSGAR
jgi:hypothetical protein